MPPVHSQTTDTLAILKLLHSVIGVLRMLDLQTHRRHLKVTKYLLFWGFVPLEITRSLSPKLREVIFRHGICFKSVYLNTATPGIDTSKKAL